MKALVKFYAFTFFITFSLSVQAGWIITQVSNGSFGEEKTETVYIQNNKMKTVTDDGMMIFDLNTNQFYVFNTKHKMYWNGTMKEYSNKVAEVVKLQIEMAVNKLPPEQKASGRKMYQIMYADMQKCYSNQHLPKDKFVIEVRKIPERETFAMYQAQKHELWVDGVLREEIWISEQLNVCNDFDMLKYNKLMCELKWNLQNIAFQNTSEYNLLFKKGYFFKSVEYQNGEVSTTEVTDVEEKMLSANEFSPPTDFKRVDLLEISKQNLIDLEEMENE